ncbi:DUF4255 domain-containing protein [Paraburkholderia aspalathi]|uniref:DUF4255 domain-containing protein n=1 Tax=Paraburkholderia aspalathi TaxID=1324617 RepID=UPI0038B981B2
MTFESTNPPSSGAPRPSDDILVRVNIALLRTLQQYVPPEIQFQFDLPAKEKLPGEPTVCLFLYDIQEDLELRHGESRVYQTGDGKFAPGRVNIRCCYLVTYWEPAQSQPALANGQSMVVMNTVLNALLNLHLDREVEQYLQRPVSLQVIAPSERLSSLGNFWQSLGDRPRLSLGFTVTVPLELAVPDDEKPVPPVMQAGALSTPSATPVLEALAQTFRRALVAAVLPGLDGMPTARVQLERLAVSCLNDGSKLDVPARISVAGLLDSACHKAVTAWLGTPGSWPDAVKALHDAKVDTGGLTEIKPLKSGGQPVD